LAAQSRLNQRRLLVAHPEHGSADHQDYQEQNGPGINGTVGFTGFGWIAHRIASYRFY
jgi:hypothetical protein